MNRVALRLTRRQSLAVGAAGLASGVACGRAAERSAAARACLLIYLDGGPSHIDLLDMKPQAPAELRGPFTPIATSLPGVQVCEHLPLVARQMHRLALVRSVTHDQTVHDPAVYQMLTGYPHPSTAGGLEVSELDVPQLGTAFGAVDRTPAVMPKVIQVPETMKMQARVLPGQNAGFLGASYDPFAVDVTYDGAVHTPDFDLQVDIGRPRLERRARLLSTLGASPVVTESPRFDLYRDQAFEILRTPQVAAAFDLERESPETRTRYGRHRHGQSVLLARRMIEAGARFVTVYWGHEDQDWADGRGARPANNPWDTHRNHFPLVEQTLAPRADQTLSALVDDLADRGLLDETLVVWMGDFGRTPRISKPWASRDHWPFAFSLLMAGGGVRGGQVLGATDDQGAYVTDRPVTPGDVTATIFQQLGVDPRATVPDGAGRPHRISPGRPIDELLG